MIRRAVLQMNGRGGPAANGAAAFPTIEDYVGDTPLVRLQRLPGRVAAERNNVILGKLEGNNPAGSVKDRYYSSQSPHASITCSNKLDRESTRRHLCRFLWVVPPLRLQPVSYVANAAWSTLRFRCRRCCSRAWR